MFIATNKIPVPAAHQEKMKQAFQKNTPSLKEIPGFLHFELWTTEDFLVSVSKWESKEAFDNYVKSDLFRQHHGSDRNAHAGKTEITFYDGEAII
jgi:heme-degrading monooxygenase HmoA